ncbi:MAG TPA: DUF1080 domain-containing protein [Pirellulales bacterium]|nr:DUF1080 domain-containing protein [Pirellulales bacterium]
MMTAHRFITGLAAVACFTGFAQAGEPAGFRMSLFNGQNLDGWHVTGCEAAVENGAVVLKAGNGFVRADHEYGDFALDLQWRARKPTDYDSGVYFRAEPVPKGSPWPKRYQVNLLEGKEGNVNGLIGAESSGLVKAGEWNRFKLTVVGETAELEINGRRAWQVSGVEVGRGHIGLQAEVDKGGEFEFREIYVTELDHHSIFNGRDLTGWEGGGADAAACWTVDEGVLLCTGKPGPWLRGKAQYGDFNLRLEYLLKPGGNSGVYVRVPADGAHQGREMAKMAGGEFSGVEVQILDDASDRYRDIQPYQFCGSVYAIAPAWRHVCRPPGHWNSLEIDCRSTTYRVVHNGVVIVTAAANEFPELNRREIKGFLGLQNHSEEVRFRNLRIAEAP